MPPDFHLDKLSGGGDGNRSLFKLLKHTAATILNAPLTGVQIAPLRLHLH
jgi:hypothetical protein